MNKRQLVATIARSTKAAPTVVEAVLRAYEEATIATLNTHGRARLPGIGILRMTVAQACRRRDPRTGEPVDVPPRIKVRFRGSSRLIATI